MLLVDVGNTNIKIYQDGDIKSFKASKSFKFPKEKFYYICVNSTIKPILESLLNAIDLEPMIELDSHYKGLGVDRKVVCCACSDAVIVDAGSAITVDVMKDAKHKGGFIMLGVKSFRQSFANISDRLVYDLKPLNDLDNLPNNTDEALNFATFNSIKSLINLVRDGLPLIFCGGDGKMLCGMFDDAKYESDLVFKGMKEVLGC